MDYASVTNRTVRLAGVNIAARKLDLEIYVADKACE